MKQFLVILVFVAAASAASESDGLITTALKFVKDCNDKSITLCIKVRSADDGWQSIRLSGWENEQKKKEAKKPIVTETIGVISEPNCRINRAQFSQFAGASTSISRQDRRRLRDHRGNQPGANWWAIAGPLAERRRVVWRPGDTRTRSRLIVGWSRRTLPRLSHSPIQGAKRLNQRRPALIGGR